MLHVILIYFDYKIKYFIVKNYYSSIMLFKYLQINTSSQLSGVNCLGPVKINVI